MGYRGGNLTVCLAYKIRSICRPADGHVRAPSLPTHKSDRNSLFWKVGRHGWSGQDPNQEPWIELHTIAIALSDCATTRTFCQFSLIFVFSRIPLWCSGSSFLRLTIFSSESSIETNCTRLVWDGKTWADLIVRLISGWICVGQMRTQRNISKAYRWRAWRSSMWLNEIDFYQLHLDFFSVELSFWFTFRGIFEFKLELC